MVQTKRQEQSLKRAHDIEAAKNEFDRVIANWCDYTVPWKELYQYEKELNMAPGQRKIDVYDNLWGIDMRILMDHLIERNGVNRIFGYLPEMCKNSPCQLGAWSTNVRKFFRKNDQCSKSSCDNSSSSFRSRSY